jgi:hypothetical protein
LQRHRLHIGETALHAAVASKSATADRNTIPPEREFKEF